MWYNYLVTNDMKCSIRLFIKWFLMMVKFRLNVFKYKK